MRLLVALLIEHDLLAQGETLADLGDWSITWVYKS